MKRRKYKEPIAQVFMLQHHAWLLAGSNTGGLGEPEDPENQNWN